MNLQSKPDRREFAWLLALVLLALALRGAILVRYAADLTDDRDAYLALAEGLIEGRGFSVPGSQQPTAFRPPLYPLAVAAVTALFGRWGVPGLHLFAAAVTCLLIYGVGRHLKLPPPARRLAVAIYAVDPLSVRYLAYPMTETVCTLLTITFIYCLTSPSLSRSNGRTPRRAELGACLLAGLSFGSLVLCRPTFWLFGLALFCLSIPVGVIGKPAQEADAERTIFKDWCRRGIVVGIGVLAVTLPWLVRNSVALGTPILMTTHGGYTRLLGNNEAFYREVVQQRIGTIWDGSHGPGQAAWYDSINRRMQQAGIEGEVNRDRWMTEEANRVIAEYPGSFLRAAELKFLWFWSVVPHRDANSELPGIILWGVGLFYAIFWLAVVWGLISLLRNRKQRDWSWHGWGAVVLLVVTLTAAHLVYWSDARMRAPLIPVLALLAVAWWPERAPAANDCSNSQTAM